MHKIVVRITPEFLIIICAALLIVPVKWIVAWGVASIIHESGHYLALRLCKVPVYALQIGIRGAKIETGHVQFPVDLISALSGPAAGACVMLFSRYIPRTAVCALFQTLWNLIPVFPMDGGRAVLSLVNRFFSDYSLSASKQMKHTAFASIFGVALLLSVKGLSRVWMVLFIVYLLLRNKNEKSLAKTAQCEYNESN